MNGGIDALAVTKVTVKATQSGLMYDRAFSGSGADTDIVVSSVRAYINALNKMIDHVSKRQGVENSLGTMEFDEQKV